MPDWRDYDDGEDDFGSACIGASLRIGSNTTSSHWEYSVNGVYGQRVWHQGGTGAYDTGEIEFMLNVEPYGGEDSVGWTIGNSPTLDAGDKVYNEILKVGVEAIGDLANAGFEIRFRDVVATFYNSSFVPTVTPASKEVFRPTMLSPFKTGDKRSGKKSSSSQRKAGRDVAVVTPAMEPLSTETQTPQVVEAPSGTVRVIVTGTVQLKGPSATNPNQLIGHIYVWTDSCDDA